MFSIDNHDLTVIEADSVETQPVTVNTIQIFTAQRYSFVVSTPATNIFAKFELKHIVLE